VGLRLWGWGSRLRGWCSDILAYLPYTCCEIPLHVASLTAVHDWLPLTDLECNVYVCARAYGRVGVRACGSAPPSPARVGVRVRANSTPLV